MKFRISELVRDFNAYRLWVSGPQKLWPAQNRWFTCASVRSEDATAPPNTHRRKKSSTLRFLPLKPKKWKCAKFGGFFVFLRHVGQVKTERDAGISQPLVAREQGFLHGGGFGCLGTLRGAFRS